MSLALIIIGAALIALGAATLARGRRLDPTTAEEARTQSVVMLLTGAAFVAAGAIAGK